MGVSDIFRMAEYPAPHVHHAGRSSLTPEQRKVREFTAEDKNVEDVCYLPVSEVSSLYSRPTGDPKEGLSIPLVPKGSSPLLAL